MLRKESKQKVTPHRRVPQVSVEASRCLGLAPRLSITALMAPSTWLPARQKRTKTPHQVARLSSQKTLHHFMTWKQQWQHASILRLPPAKRGERPYIFTLLLTYPDCDPPRSQAVPRRLKHGLAMTSLSRNRHTRANWESARCALSQNDTML